MSTPTSGSIGRDAHIAFSILYGKNAEQDWEFCVRHGETINRYFDGLMTVAGCNVSFLEPIAADPMSVPGWKHLLEERSEDGAILQEFVQRLIRARGLQKR